VALQGFGRLKLGQSTLYTEYPGWDNPNLYQTTLNLAALGSNLPIASITFTKPGSSGSSGIFGVSGAVMPSAVSITQPPQSTTNVVPAQGATFRSWRWGRAVELSVVLQHQRQRRHLCGADDQTNSSLVLSPVLQTSNAGSSTPS